MRTRSVLISLFAGLAAGLGLAWLVVNRPPSNPNLVTALTLLALALIGLLTPPLAWLHARLPLGGRGPAARSALRQATLLALVVVLAAVLQLRGLLDGASLLGLAALVVLVELFLQNRR